MNSLSLLAFSPPSGKSLSSKSVASGGSDGGGGAAGGAGGKPVSMAEVVKQARAGKGGQDQEDGLVMETKLKIIEILQVERLHNEEIE